MDISPPPLSLFSFLCPYLCLVALFPIISFFPLKEWGSTREKKIFLIFKNFFQFLRTVFLLIFCRLVSYK